MNTSGHLKEGTHLYNRDGYTGTLTLDTASIPIKPMGYEYETVTNSHPHRVTKQYALTYNDRSLVSETVKKADV